MVWVRYESETMTHDYSSVGFKVSEKTNDSVIVWWIFFGHLSPLRLRCVLLHSYLLEFSANICKLWKQKLQSHWPTAQKPHFSRKTLPHCRRWAMNPWQICFRFSGLPEAWKRLGSVGRGGKTMSSHRCRCFFEGYPQFLPGIPMS